MAGVAIQHIAPPAPGMASIKKGDILPGSVIEKINAVQYRVRLSGVETVVNTRVPMQVGQRLLLRVEAFSPRLKLKLIAAQQTISASNNQWLPLLQLVGVKNDPLSLALIEHLLLFRIPLRKTVVQSMRQAIGRVHKKKRISPEVLLAPLGIWYDADPEMFFAHPLLLFQWYWEQATPQQRKVTALPSDNTPLATLLHTLQLAVANGTAVQSWPELGIKLLRQYLPDFYQKNPLSEAETLKFKFVLHQWERWKRGQWAIFPVELNHHRFFLHLLQMTRGQKQQVLVDFTVPLEGTDWVPVRVIFTPERLTIQFWNPSQAFREAVDNKITLFCGILEEITKYRNVEIQANPHLKAFLGLSEYFREMKLKYTGVL